MSSLLRNLAKRKSPAVVSPFKVSTSSPIPHRHLATLLTPKCRKNLDYTSAVNSPCVARTFKTHQRPPDKSKIKDHLSTKSSLNDIGDNTFNLILGAQEEDMNLKTNEIPSISCGPDDGPSLFDEVKIGSWMKWWGKGSFGVVVSATLRDDEVALKICRKPAVPTIGEINAVNLRHPHLVRVLGTKDRTSVRLVVMEIGGDRNLQNVLDDNMEVINFERRLRFCQQIVSGMSYCHEKELMHLDLKPSNILIYKDNCKICDFGCSVKYATCLNKYERCLLGTPRYCAPEILKSAPPTYQCDVYSFGIMMWQIFTRQIPYGDLDVHVLIYKVVALHFRPLFPPLEEVRERKYAMISERCWDPDPLQRPTSNAIVTLLSRVWRAFNNAV